jgi:hypothetical protein
MVEETSNDLEKTLVLERVTLSKLIYIRAILRGYYRRQDELDAERRAAKYEGDIQRVKELDLKCGRCDDTIMEYEIHETLVFHELLSIRRTLIGMYVEQGKESEAYKVARRMSWQWAKRF